ncbi:corticosteroid-binding globulin-like [Ochotona curzoniae]|uniref:corticosteroid-binding globulin-like n=1 Tax=Ochotona curzoniae TaxID=130825 RepID=UPI001B3497A2|nr:corticosteroid-binding globulin-like [Ochotona curzoniae]
MPLATYTCLLWLLTSGLWTTQAEDPPDDGICTRSPHRGLAPANVDFAFSLFRQLVASAPDKNMFISPVSISMALAMLSLGASGHTRTQLLQGLGFNLTDTPEAEIHQGFQHLHRLLGELGTSLDMTLGNALFLDHSLELLESFSANIKLYYESKSLATDFQDWDGASRQINKYIENKTQGKIVHLFSGVESPATLILVNYIFFKGTWAHSFDQEGTREKNFYVNETTTVLVPMMFQSSTIKYLHDSVLPCQLVQLDYMGNGTAFFILPDEGKMDTVIAALSRDTIQRWSNLLTSSWVHLYIPKASITGDHKLRGVLAAMGISDLFTNRANFSNLAKEAQLKVSEVVHKAVLQLDEKGAEAAVSPGRTLQLVSEPLTISFNRPFLIMIFDHFTWSSLFLGKIVSPA